MDEYWLDGDDCTSVNSSCTEGTPGVIRSLELLE